MVTVSRLTIVKTLLSKDDSRIPHAIRTKTINNLLMNVIVDCFSYIYINGKQYIYIYTYRSTKV